MNKNQRLKELFFKPPLLKRLILMLIGVFVMGICVSVLRLTHFGTDPCSAMNYGISGITGLSFGTVQVIVALVLLGIVLIFDYGKLGLGTIGNMFVVGYTADLTTWFTSKVLGIESLEGFMTRLIVMLVFVTVFIFAVALYVNSGLGASAYDVIPYIIREKLSKALRKEIPFKAVRIGFDAFFTIVAFLLKGEVGAITLIMVLTLGPVIDYVAGLLKKVLKL